MFLFLPLAYIDFMDRLDYEVVACSNDSDGHPAGNIIGEIDFYESHYLDEKWARHEKHVDIIVRFKSRVQLEKVELDSL